MVSEYLPLISALTALAAVVVGPTISLRIAKKQIKASQVSSNRQAWINRLRDEVAHFTREVKHLPSSLAARAIITEQAISRYENLSLKQEIVKLLLNPTEEEHQELMRLMTNASQICLRAINLNKGMAEEMDKSAELVVSQCQKILKSEWERVKRAD